MAGELTIPDEITAIGKKAFQYSKLKTINFSSNITSIGVDAFLESDLESVEFPASLKTIEMSAFYNCSKLQSIKLNAPSLIDIKLVDRLIVVRDEHPKNA